jgi:hypothetical protein
MALKRTKLLNIQSVTGIATVGIFTAGVTSTAAGVAGTTYIRGVIMHNTGLATCTSSLYINPNTTPVSIAITANRIARVDLASNETFFFESNYPIVLTTNDTVSVEITAPAASGGVGIGSVVNYQVLGDTDI